MDTFFGNGRFRDIEGPPLPTAPPDDLVKRAEEAHIRLPYLSDSPHRGQIRLLPLPERLLAMHMLIAGAINSGKSNLFKLLIMAILYAMTHFPERRNDTVVIFDPKGEFRRLFYRPGIDIVISPSGCPEWRWNLMEELKAVPEPNARVGTVDRGVLNDIGHILFDHIAERTSQPFFAKAGRRLFCGVFERLACEPGNTNARILNFWNSASVEEIRQLLGGDSRMRGLLNYIPSNVEGQTMGVLSEIQGVVNDLFQGGFAEPGDISIRSAIRKGCGKVIFLDFRASSAATMADSFRVLVALSIREALRMGEETEASSERKIWFVIDEFRRLPHIMQFEPGMNFGRSYGLRFILGMQSIEQLKKDYEVEASSILAGANSMFGFWVSDLETRRFIKDRGGKKLQRIAVENVGIGNPIQNVEERDAIQDHHVAALGPGQAIVCLPQHKPFTLRFPLYEDFVRMERTRQ